ncbi:hypothetical protein [Luteolibacter sp. LG18]|uniref:hypothetical protein n=1 Tax=Luteolibacter sp. LG18 TaxID=2819286 RepID=UPI002B2A9382|nr:hypothetical protein llg_07080 [Luteolibacter sp. LG18]BCU79663.1 hypothetical protein llg_43780 [Luteolibacter sp. LG18]
MNSNKAIFSTQSNTQAGHIPGEFAADLTGKEGLLAKLTSDGFALPSAASDLTLWIILEGGATSGTVLPLTPLENVRVRANGTGSKGDILVLATGGDLGKATKLAAQTGRLFVLGIAEEDWEDEQLVLFRPHPHYLDTGSAPTAFSGATPAATGSSNAATPYGFTTSAQADALVTTVREIRAALVAKGIMA